MARGFAGGRYELVTALGLSLVADLTSDQVLAMRDTVVRLAPAGGATTLRAISVAGVAADRAGRPATSTFADMQLALGVVVTPKPEP